MSIYYCCATKQNAIIPSIKLGWVRETRFHGKKIHARLVDVPNGYTVEGLYPNRNMLAVGASLTGILYQMAHLSLAYEGFFGSEYKSSALNVVLDLRF